MTYDRDLIGYADTPPDPKWPGGARIALNFVMNYEEGSEPSVQDGDGFSETGLHRSRRCAIRTMQRARPGRRRQCSPMAAASASGG